MNKLTVSAIRSVKPGSSTTFKLDSCAAVYNGASLVGHTQKKYMEVDKVKYSCSKDTENNKITIEAKSII